MDFCRDYQERYVVPRFGQKKITAITRDEIKKFMSDLTQKGLAKNTIRLAVAALRVVLSSAVEEGILASNPGLKLGRFLESNKVAHQAQAMTRGEAQAFLEATKEFHPEFHLLFLRALRAGLRKGELLAVRWGDIQFGNSENDSNRYILVQRNYVQGKFTTPKSKKSRRGDFKSLLEALHRDFLPAGFYEEWLVVKIAECMWRLLSTRPRLAGLWCLERSFSLRLYSEKTTKS